MYRCPRYNFCNAPICPLDPDYKLRVFVNGDEKCTLSKRLRMMLGVNLDNKGLKPREKAGLDIWNSRSNESKELALRKGKENIDKSKFTLRI